MSKRIWRSTVFFPDLLNSLAWTDSLQAIVMVISATLVVIFVIYELGGLGSFFGTLHSEHSGALSVPGNGFFSFSTFLGLTLPWVFFSLSNPQVSQRLFTRSEEHTSELQSRFD